MVLGFVQTLTLTQMGTSNLSVEYIEPGRKADNLAAICK
jgi:hypothetical protein